MRKMSKSDYNFSLGLVHMVTMVLIVGLVALGALMMFLAAFL